MKIASNRVLIEPVSVNRAASIGVLFPDNNKTPPQLGVVVQSGENVSGLNKGDRVVFNGSKGERLVQKFKELLIVREQHCFAKITT